MSQKILYKVYFFVSLLLFIQGCGGIHPAMKLCEDANILYQNGNYDDAINLLTQVLNRNDLPNRSIRGRVHALRAEAYRANVEFEKAIQDIKVAASYEEDEKVLEQYTEFYMDTIKLIPMQSND